MWEIVNFIQTLKMNIGALFFKKHLTKIKNTVQIKTLELQVQAGVV